jgi:hypothetical protein
MSPTGDEVFRWFRDHGWSVSEVGMVELDGKTNWVLTARQGEEVILAKSAVQAEARAKAIRLIAQRNDGVSETDSGP